ncbi:MAG: hypothetical protein ACI9F9_000778 [Candidatus Paceibacteria bacterium]|jgi:hypothetical protein
MSTLKSTLLLSTLALSATPFATAQQVSVVAPAGPIVTVTGQVLTPHFEMGASRSFQMLEGFRGVEAAHEISGRLMARGRGLSAAPALNMGISSDGQRLEYVDAADPSSFVMVGLATGDISFCRGMQGFEVLGNTPNLPKGEEATRLALDHLQRLGLLPLNRAEMNVQHIGGLRMAQRNEDGTNQDFDKLTTVHFGRTLDGLPVGGPGSKITVHLGANGELVGMQRRWIELRSSSNAESEFLSAGEALQGVESHLREEWSRAETVRSESPQPGFYDDGHGRIEPALFFRAELGYDEEIHEFARGDYTKDYLGVISALRNSEARFDQQAKAAISPTDADPQQLPGPDVEGEDE